MSDSTSLDAARADTLLTALGEQLALREERYMLVVVGGSALLALGLVARTTRDVDVLAILDGGSSSLPTRSHTVCLRQGG